MRCHRPRYISHEYAMTIRAESDPKFYWRFIIIGVVVTGFSLYCVYDGRYGYPQQRIRALKFEEFEKEKKLGEWPEYAESQGWSTDPPGKPKTEAEIASQYVFAAVTAVLALWFFTIVLINRGHWIESNETGVTSSWGKGFNYSDVVELNKKQWKKKGIAKVYFEENGRRGRFVIDDYKFKREPTDEILQALENHIDHAKITGGPPEGYETVYEEPENEGGDGLKPAGGSPVEA
jgi:hypothetical protein